MLKSGMIKYGGCPSSVDEISGEGEVRFFPRGGGIPVFF